jgi:hypothetical protein
VPKSFIRLSPSKFFCLLNFQAQMYRTLASILHKLSTQKDVKPKKIRKDEMFTCGPFV